MIETALNPILMIAHGNLALTKQAVASVFAQDIPVVLSLVDNASADGTAAWMDTLIAPSPHILWKSSNTENISPVKLANIAYKKFFDVGAGHVLTMNTDQILPSNCYRELLKWPRGFVSATDVGQHIPEVRDGKPVNEGTPFVVILVRKWAYDAMVATDGYFYDENFFLYASDCDLAVRRVRCGIRGITLDTPVWHYGSATLNLAAPKRKREIELIADKDRAYFKKKWGFGVEEMAEGLRTLPFNFTDGQPYDIGFKVAQ